MTPRFEPAGLKKAAPWEYAVRFVFGGIVTVCAGVIAKKFGPSIGGLFLAFPAILPASITLLTRHHGREHARQDAHGACLGVLGLSAFAVTAWALARAGLWLALLLGSIAWIAVCVGAWALWYGRDADGRRL